MDIDNSGGKILMLCLHCGRVEAFRYGGVIG